MKIPEQKTISLIAWRKFLVAVLLPRHFLFYDLSFHLPVQFVSSTLFQQLVQLSVPFWLSTIILIKCFDLYPLLKINPTVRKLTNVFEFTRRPQNLEPFFHVPEYILDFQKEAHHSNTVPYVTQVENIYGSDFFANCYRNNNCLHLKCTAWNAVLFRNTYAVYWPTQCLSLEMNC